MKSNYETTQRRPDGTVDRTYVQEDLQGLLGISDPNAKLRTNRHLLSIIDGKAQGTVEKAPSEGLDFGTPIEGGDPGNPGVLDRLLNRPYSVDPAEVGSYVESLASTVRSRQTPTDLRDDPQVATGSAPSSDAEHTEGA